MRGLLTERRGRPRARRTPAPDPGPGPAWWRPLAVALALLATIALNGSIIVGSEAAPFADLTHFKHWARLVSVEGMHAAYSGEYPETYAVYPPVTLATFRLAGLLYQRTVDPSFDLDRALASHALSVLIRLQALLFHLLVGLAVLAVAARTTSFLAAYVAMVAYLFNPGASCSTWPSGASRTRCSGCSCCWPSRRLAGARY